MPLPIDPLRRPPRIAVVLPANARFGPDEALSIDLYVRDLARFSTLRDTTRVFGNAVDRPFDEVASSLLPPQAHGARYRQRARQLAPTIRAFAPDLIVVHEHFKTAALLADLCGCPCVFVAHSFQKRMTNWLRLAYRTRIFNRLSGLVFVSEATRDAFLTDFPHVDLPRTIVYNALDPGQWHPARNRDRSIVFVGRAESYKSVLETIAAMDRVIACHPDWSGEVILGRGGRDDYTRAIEAAVARSAGRVSLSHHVPHTAVQRRFENAAIAVAASKGREPFGRVAMEAMAGGCALVTTREGGLTEVLGTGAAHTGVALATVSETALAREIEALVRDPGRREQMAFNGRRRVETAFHIRQSAAAFDRFCLTLTGRPVSYALAA